MALRLSGYFDDNFGDDYMMKIIVRKLKDIDFVIPHKGNISQLLLEEKNVSVTAKNDKNHQTLVVTGSGFMVNSPKVLVSEFKRTIKGISPGDFCLGCNIEPFSNKLYEFVMKKKLEKFKLIVCRDKKSYRWLKLHNKKSEIKYLPDILFSMPKEWLIKPQGNKLGISVMNLGNEEWAVEYYKAMACVADYYINTTNEGVVLLAFDTGNEDDVSACETVKNHAACKDKISIVQHGCNGEIIKAYSQCRKIIATRFHSAVLALKTGIDMYPIIFRNKLKNMLDDVGYPIKGCYVKSCNTEDIKKFIDLENTPFKVPQKIIEDADCYTNLFLEFLKESGHKI